MDLTCIPNRRAPRYLPGGSANPAICLVVALVALGLRLVHIRENQKLVRLEMESEYTGDSQDANVRADGFRYVV
jgi:hypothetical protein